MPLAQSSRGARSTTSCTARRAGSRCVLVMGMGGSCRGWLPLQVPEFSQQRRTLIFDHRGVGGSEDPGGPFSTAQMADDTAGLLDALGIERADVLGVFMGGMVAQELALRHPRRVDRLVLVGTYARPDAKRRLLLEQWRELARSGASIETLVRERLLWTLQDDTLEQQDLIDAMVEFFTRDGAPLTRGRVRAPVRGLPAPRHRRSAAPDPPAHAGDVRAPGRAHAAEVPSRARRRDPGRAARHDRPRRAPGDGRVGGELQPHACCSSSATRGRCDRSRA